MSSIRATPKGKEKNRLSAKDGMSSIRATTEGKEKNRLSSKDGMSSLRDTTEGKEKNRISTLTIRRNSSEFRQKAFDEVKEKSMTDPSIIHTKAFQLIASDWQKIKEQGPEYTCAICIKQEWRSNVLNLDSKKYKNNADLFARCYQGRHYWLEHCLNSEIFEDRFRERKEYICCSCDKHLLKGKMPPQSFANGLQLYKLEEEVKDLCPLELMLISRILPFMFIIPKHKGAQFGLKGQCVLVPTDLKKVEANLPRACNENCVIPLVLKRRLSDKSYHSKQNIRPTKVNKALDKLKEINPFYQTVHIDNSWEKVSKESDPELWNLLTDENAESDAMLQSDSDEEIEGNDVLLEKQKKIAPCLTQLFCMISMEQM